MLLRDFDRATKEALQPLLSPLGFSSSRSKHCTFEREAGNGIWHFIGADPSKHGRWYDIKVFASSPIMDPFFAQRAPDNLGIPVEGRSEERRVGRGGVSTCRSRRSPYH